MKPNLRKLLMVLTIAAAGLGAAAEASADPTCIPVFCIPEPRPIHEPACLTPCLCEDFANIADDVDPKCYYYR